MSDFVPRQKASKNKSKNRTQNQEEGIEDSDEDNEESKEGESDVEEEKGEAKNNEDETYKYSDDDAVLDELTFQMEQALKSMDESEDEVQEVIPINQSSSISPFMKKTSQNISIFKNQASITINNDDLEISPNCNDSIGFLKNEGLKKRKFA